MGKSASHVSVEGLLFSFLARRRLPFCVLPPVSSSPRVHAGPALGGFGPLVCARVFVRDACVGSALESP